MTNLTPKSIETMLHELKLHFERFPDGIFGVRFETQHYFDDDVCEKALFVLITLDAGCLHIISPCHAVLFLSEHPLVGLQAILSLSDPDSEAFFKFDIERKSIECRCVRDFSDEKFDHFSLLQMINNVLLLVDMSHPVVERAYLFGTHHQSTDHPKELSDLVAEVGGVENLRMILKRGGHLM